MIAQTTCSAIVFSGVAAWTCILVCTKPYFNEFYFLLVFIAFFWLPLVYDACAESCEHLIPFDGMEKGILNMNGYLIGHDVLRDYLANFLCGRFVLFSVYEKCIIYVQFSTTL